MIDLWMVTPAHVSISVEYWLNLRPLQIPTAITTKATKNIDIQKTFQPEMVSVINYY